MSRTRPSVARPEEFKLSNGIPVILQHLEGSVAASYWWNQTGSVHERKGEEGFAHFLEHMFFKDTSAKETGRASSGATARAIEGFGGDINAYTSFEQTVYHVTCAEQHWEKVLGVFGAMAKPSRFLKLDFQREREVILEELAKTEDSPGRQSFQTLATSVWSKHPYGRPVIGFDRTLKAATLAKLEAFRARRYIPSRMGLIMVGPMEDAGGKRKKELLRMLERMYGSAVIRPAKAEAEPRLPQEPALRKGPAFKARKFDVETPSASVAFRVPELMHADIPALELIAGALGAGETSRLYQRLFYGKSLVTDVSAGVYAPNDPGIFYMDLDVGKTEQVLPAMKEAFAEMARIWEEGPTPEEIEKVVTNLESEKLYAAQTADGVAGRLGFLRYVLGDLTFDQKYLEDLKALSPERVKAVAREYLDARRMGGAMLYPKKEENFDTRPVLELAEKVFAPPVISKPARAATKSTGKEDAPFQIFRRESGLKVAYRYRPQSHAFSIYASAPGGTRLELGKPLFSAEKDWGASHLLALTWTKGTRGRSARDIAGLVEGRAAVLDGFSGRNTLGLEMTGLSRDWSQLSELFQEVFLEPVFPAEEVEHSRRVAEDSIRGIQDHSGQLCSKLFIETLFENHPYGRITLGSLESLPGLNQGTLHAYHSHWVRPERVALSVVGSVPPKEFEAWLDRFDRAAIQKASAGGAPAQGPEKLSDEPEPQAPRWAHRKLGREQSHILVGSLGIRMDSEDRHSLRLLQTLLSGQSGRLFIELREKRSLAYSVAPTGFEGLERGYVGTYMACSTEKTKEAVDGIARVLEQLAAKGPNAAELGRAKEFFLGRRAMDLQSDSSLASYYGLELQYQGKITTEAETAERIRTLGVKDLQRVCKRYLVDPHKVTVIVG